MRQQRYNSLGQKKGIKQAAYAQGESIIHDDFVDSDGNQTDGSSGLLTIDVIPQPDSTIINRIKELDEKLDDDTMTFEELKEYTRLKR